MGDRPIMSKKNMRIVMITTWDKQCGIAEYAKNLVIAMREQGLDITVIEKDSLVNMVPQDLSHYDIIHFQNQGSFWSGEWLMSTLKLAKSKKQKTFITFHDSAYWPGFDFQNIDLAIAHRKDIFEEMSFAPSQVKAVLPMGVPEIKPTLCSFGIGRNDNNLIADVCNDLGFKYKIPNKWLSTDELVEFIKSSDGVVLWYNDVGIVGSSAAARLAIGCRRPLFLSNVKWFEDLYEKNVFKFDTIEELKTALYQFYKNDFIDKYGFNTLARKHKELYES